jgi:lipopolysaccharide biosynthesis protein
LGDVVLVADSDMDSVQVARLQPYCIHVSARRHQEYDFGSYKRAYAWAASNLELSTYDFIYLVNDSVYGPLYDLGEYLCRMEGMSVPAFSLVLNPHKRHPHMQSWFIGLDRTVFLQEWFASFLASVKKEANKNDICVIYETGLTELIAANGIPYKGLYEVSGKKIYNSVKELYKSGLPFVKKAAFTRHNGSLGAQLKYVVAHLDKGAQKAILCDAERVYGTEYIQNLLTSNPLTIAVRYLSYLLSKI